MRFGSATRAAFAFQRALQPPATPWRWASSLNVSPERTVNVAPRAVLTALGLAYVFLWVTVFFRATYVFFLLTVFFGAVYVFFFVTVFLVVTGALTLERAVAPEEAPPLERVRPARTEHTGHAPGPCEARTLWATAICADLEARSAREAYCP